MGKTNAEYLRDLRSRAVAAGRCQTCRARDAEPSRVTCRKCLDEGRARKLARQAAARAGVTTCVACAARPRASGCIRCERCNARERARAKVRLSLGKCRHCRRPALVGTTMCAHHHEINRARVKAQRTEVSRAR